MYICNITFILIQFCPQEVLLCLLIIQSNFIHPYSNNILSTTINFTFIYNSMQVHLPPYLNIDYAGYFDSSCMSLQMFGGSDKFV